MQIDDLLQIPQRRFPRFESQPPRLMFQLKFLIRSIDYEMYSPNRNTKFDSVLLEQLISVKETVLGHCAVTTDTSTQIRNPSKPVVPCSDPKVVGLV
ncbi:hypothetical protein L1987_12215 [Smallanthus sonchifolius]|uniref:Uncharacterized protein n=1 Tax=Smallanthus sonchifolius TaxID=185202 RepID=A0ACB9JD53_9ASTR|nr:hypothetical protein L1987_12215 [Smallanthus sonchifolius]